MNRNRIRRLQLTTCMTAALTVFGAFFYPELVLAADPTKWIRNFQVGRNVNDTRVHDPSATQEERNECTVKSKDVCQHGEEGTGPREFFFDEGIAVSKLTGDVYVGEKNHRVQVLGPQGEFLYMFGWNVNVTKVTNGGTQQEKNICTENEIESGATCGKGEKGTGLAGQIDHAEGVTVDPVTGDVYVLDPEYNRVDKYSATGEFLLMIGGEVNRKGGNVCTKAEESECQIGIEGSGHLAFDKVQKGSYGNLLTIGGPENRLYIADERRVQQLKTDGTWIEQISVPGEVLAVAVDGAGDMFVTDSAGPGVHEYNAADELQSCVIDPTGGGIQGLALDSSERLGLTELSHGAVYDTQAASCGTLVTEIAGASGTAPQLTAMAFSLHENSKSEAEDSLYIANPGEQEIEGYLPVLFPEVETCATESVTYTSAKLCGKVNPSGVPTRGFFKYGVKQSDLEQEGITAFLGEGVIVESMHDPVTGLTPNRQYYDQAWVEAESGGAEQRQSAPQIVGFRTRGPPPEIPGSPTALFVRDQSADLSATVNPEHAMTKYRFEYARCENERQIFAACLEPRRTNDLSSEAYGSVSVIQEISGLAPRTAYAYRLTAENEFEVSGMHEGGRAVGAEGHLTTGSLPMPSADTGAFGSVTATSAVIAGAVDPDGPAATYVFELGVYAGASTQYGIVFSGPVGASLEPVEETLALSGLQPATTYAYRIGIKSGYVGDPTGEARGETRVFTTSGLPALLESPAALAMLPIPAIKFPGEGNPPSKPLAKCKRGYQRDKRDRCVKQRKRAKKAARSKRKAGVRGKSGR